MNIQLKLIVMALLVLTLSACAGNTILTPEVDVLSATQTAAEQTLVVQTSTLPATVTPFPTSIPTLHIPPTFANIVSPTIQSVTSYTSNSILPYPPTHIGVTDNVQVLIKQKSQVHCAQAQVWRALAISVCQSSPLTE